MSEKKLKMVSIRLSQYHRDLLEQARKSDTRYFGLGNTALIRLALELAYGRIPLLKGVQVPDLGEGEMEQTT